jgi:DNA helicase II / ATP-dependent DNA helicase PcrA
LENLALVSDQDTLPAEATVPTLLTLHAAKGLEFSQVFIVGLDEGILPHSRSLDEPEEMAEERRLLYVGITRAKNRVTLVRANQRTTYGSFESSVASRFLDDIPERLLFRASRKGGSSGRSSGRDSGREERREWGSRWETGSGNASMAPSSAYTAAQRAQRAPQPPEPPKQMYKAGNHVRHPVWGEGLVIEARMDGADERVDVIFDSVGLKRLIASLAKLEII